MKTTQLNHVALHVADVGKSSVFYGKFLKLEPIPRPAFKFPGAWFRLGEDQELHLIGDRQQPVVGAKSRGNHWALLVDSMDEWEAFLQRQCVAYTYAGSRDDDKAVARRRVMVQVSPTAEALYWGVDLGPEDPFALDGERSGRT